MNQPLWKVVLKDKSDPQSLNDIKDERWAISQLDKLFYESLIKMNNILEKINDLVVHHSFLRRIADLIH